MASRSVQGFSVDQVVDAVCDAVPAERVLSPFEQVLEESLERFECLSGSIDVDMFKREARSALEAIKTKCLLNQGHPEHHLSVLMASIIRTGPMIAGEVLMWIKMVNRRMLYKPKIHNPWSIKFSRDIPELLFDRFRRSVGEGSTSFGISVDGNSVKYTDLRRLVRDLAKISGLSREDITCKWKKEFKGRRSGCKAKLLCTEAKPFTISFDRKKTLCTVTCYFGCWNQFGYPFHS